MQQIYELVKAARVQALPNEERACFELRRARRAKLYKGRSRFALFVLFIYGIDAVLGADLPLRAYIIEYQGACGLDNADLFSITRDEIGDHIFAWTSLPREPIDKF